MDARARPPSRTGRSKPPEPIARRVDVDWLRALVVLSVIPFHAAMVFFVTPAFPLGTGEGTAVLGYPMTFVNGWQMPVLFVLAGVSAGYALRFRTMRRFGFERFKRLFVPLVCGFFVLCPPQTYCRRLWDGDFDGSYFAFYPHFFEGVWPTGNMGWGHLWFIAYLLVISLLALPVLYQLNRGRGQRAVARLAAASQWPGVILLFALPVAASECLLRPRFEWTWALVGDWAMLTWHFLWYMIGYVLSRDDRFWHAIDRALWPALLLGVMAASVRLGLMAKGVWFPRGYNAPWMFLRALECFGTWFWIVVLMGFSQKLLRSDNSVLGYLREATYPIYILHQTALIIIAYYVLRWDMSVLARFAVITLATFAVVLVTYETAVRRWAPTRFIFGMKPARRGEVPANLGTVR